MAEPQVFTAMTCPRCGRVYTFQVPVTLRKLTEHGVPPLYHTDDDDRLPDLWVTAKSDREAADRLASTICQLVSKFETGHDSLTTHYRGRLH